MQRSQDRAFLLRIGGAGEKPVTGWIYRKWPRSNEGTEEPPVFLTILLRKIPLPRRPTGNVFMNTFHVRTMQRGVKRGIGDGGQRPSGTVTAEAAGHGATIAEEECIGGFEE
jgi:hypothetical protein